MMKSETSEDHVWADEQARKSEDRPPVAEIAGHSVEILHRGRDRTDGERDIGPRLSMSNERRDSQKGSSFQKPTSACQKTSSSATHAVFLP
jgi:hypothetical protein